MLKKIGSYFLAIIFGFVLACVLGYFIIKPGYDDSIRINEQLAQSLSERDQIITDLKAERDSIVTGLEGIIIRIDKDADIIDQLIAIERGRQKAIDRAIKIIKNSKILD